MARRLFFDMAALRDLLIRASQLRERRRYAEAAALYEEVVAAAPLLATEWYNLGFCRRMSGGFDEALAAYGQAIQLGVSEPEEAHLNRGVIFADHLLRPELAEAEYNRALTFNANYCPALLNLANLAEDRGDRAQALELYRRVLALDPEHWLALARYGKLQPDPAAPDLLARIEYAAKRTDLGPEDRANLYFALGDVCDKAGAFDLAFDAYEQANAFSRASSDARYDRTAAEALVDQIIEVFSEVSSPPETPGWAPIFICGMFRSGSTLAEQMLAGHPRISPGGEIGLIPALVHERLTPFPDKAASAEGAVFSSLAAEYVRRLRRLFPSADLVTDKWLGNYLYAGLIKRMFPSAKIVHTVRHPLDNVLSVFFLHLDASLGYAVDLMDAAHQLRLSRRLMAHWRRLYPGDVIEFRYDEFVDEPRETARALTKALGLEWDEECLAIQRRTNTVKTASVWQVRQPLYATSSGRWRNYSRHLEEVRSYLADLL